MKVIQFTAENVKRLRAVDITPRDNMVVITGRNGQGKTSVLDAIWWALGGAEVMKDTPQPIRQGEKAARVRLDLGDLVVNRAWTEKGAYLKVENSEGMEYKSPQALLDRFIGRLSFEPLAFSNMKPREQRETLLELVKIDMDLEAWTHQRQGLYEGRTIANRNAKDLEAQIKVSLLAPANTPDEEVSATEVLKEQAAAQVVKEGNDAERRRLKEIAQGCNLIREENDLLDKEIAELEYRLDRLKERRIKTTKDLEVNHKRAKKLEVEVAKLQDPDLSIYEAKIAQVEETNRYVRAKRQEADLKKALAKQQDISTTATRKIDALDQAKVDAIKAAKFPIDGLAFDDEGVTYKGIPFSQCSAAERLRVSLAMAMALNPKIKVLRITDGSLLDDDNLAIIQGMIKDNDFQLWIERVGTDGSTGILIEDGMVQ